MRGGNYGRPAPRGSGYGYRGGRGEYDPRDQPDYHQQASNSGYRGGYREYGNGQQFQGPQHGGYYQSHGQQGQSQQGYDDYRGYDHRYTGYRPQRGRGREGYHSGPRNGGRSYGYEAQSVNQARGEENGYGASGPSVSSSTSSTLHAPTAPAAQVASQTVSQTTIIPAAAAVSAPTSEEPLDLSEKHWIERLHVEGDFKRSLGELFDDLDKVNVRLDQVALRRLDVEVEVMKLERFSRTGEARCKLAEDQLEAMNLGI